MTTEEMAAALGYAPQPGSTPQELGGVLDDSLPGYAPVPQETFTEEDVMGAVVPGYNAPVEEAPAPLPAPTPGIVDPFPGPAVTKQSGKVSAGSQGFSAGQYNKVSRATGDERSRANARIDADAAQAGSLIGGAVDEAANAEIEAQKINSLAEQDYIMAESRGRQYLEGVKMDSLRQEEEANVKAQMLSAEGRANYLAALEDFRASKVNPNQLMQSMGKGDRFGTLASVFVHDFLGAAGIRTSALDTLNKAIERNIDSQVMAIKQKGEVAEGFKTLWEMQRAESSSEAEARARMRGIMWQAAEDKVASTLGTMKAGLADAKGQAAIAKIQAEKVKAQFEVFKYIDQSALQKKAQEQQWIATKMQNSIAQANLSIARAREAREAAAAKAAKDQAKLDGLIPDLSADGKGHMRWRFRDGIKPDEQAKVLDKIASTNITNRNIEEYRELLRKAKTDGDGNRGALDVGRLTSHEQAKINALHVRILSDKLREDSGLTVTDNEFKRRLAELTENKKWTDADAESIAAGFQARMQEDLHAHIRARAVDLPANAPERQIRAADAMGYESSNIEARGAWDQGPTAPALPTDNATQGLQRPDATKPAAADTVDRAISEGAKPNSDWQSYQGPGKTQLTIGSVKDGPYERELKVPAYAVHMSTLKARALQGDPIAIDQLEMYAGVGETTTVDPTSKKEYTSSNVGSMVLPDGTDANTTEGRAKRSYALHLYKLAEEAGVIK